MTDVQQEFIGSPDGPKVFVPELGMEVGTFTKRMFELERSPSMAQAPPIMHHVPKRFRGPYHPEQLENYDPDKEYPLTWDGWVRCSGKLIYKEYGDNSRAGQECKRKATHRSGYCQSHGGKLHPLDMPAPVTRDPSTMNRSELLKYGYITVDDLDDEELIRGQCRNRNGWFSTSNKNSQISKPVYDKMVSRLFDRAQEKMRENLLQAIDVLAEISQGDAFEASDRANASKFLIERVLGKTTEKIDLTVGAKPFEQILTGIAPLTREESRAQRAIEPIEIIDVTEDEWSPTEPPTSSQSYESESWNPEAVPEPAAEQSDSPAPSSAEMSPVSPEQLKDKIQTARNRRYAARAQGNSSTRNLAYLSERTPVYGAIDERVTARIQWTHPDEVKVPASVKAKETRKRNYDRKSQ